MESDNEIEAWDRFWQREAQKATGATSTQRKSTQKHTRGSGIPEGWRGIEQTCTRVWQDFAKMLPRNARVLDLATGSGEVLFRLLGARRDLKLFGVDRARELPAAPRGLTLRSGVDIADLPSPDNRFAAVTSQFGFEYADMTAAASEIARVLHPRGRVALLTHRADSPIVKHNRERRDQIHWALEDRQLLRKARSSLALRGAGLAMLPAEIIAAPEDGAAQFGPQSAAWEIAEAIRQTLHLGRNDTAANVAKILNDIERQAQNELGRIASLDAAAERASATGALAAAAHDAGLQMVEETSLPDALSGQVFADFRIFTHLR